MNQKNLSKLIEDALAIEAEEAKQAGTLGYIAWMFVQAMLPHSKLAGNEFVRKNGSFALSILSPSKIGLPYGTIPRLLLAWITREAVLTKSRTLWLGDSLSSFMQQLGIVPTGGKWGTITRLRNQSKKLFTSSVSCFYEEDSHEGERGFRIADSYNLWWDPKDPDEGVLLNSTIKLSEVFYQGITDNPVPIDMRVLTKLARSPLAIDIYCWLTYRMSYLKKSTSIPWLSLQLQFGSGYSQTPQGGRDFKRAFIRELKKTCLFYPTVNFEINQDHLTLKPSKPHILKLVK